MDSTTRGSSPYGPTCTPTQQAQPEEVTTPPEEPIITAEEPTVIQPEQPMGRKLSREEKPLFDAF